MFVFALQFQQFLLETLPTNQIFDICVCIDHVVSVVSALRLQIFNMCVFFSMCSVQFKSGGIKELRGGMFVFTLQFLQFLLETLKTIQIFDIRVRFHPVVSVVLSGRRYNFDMCVFFSGGMFFFILQFLQFLLGDSPEDLDFQYMHSF